MARMLAMTKERAAPNPRHGPACPGHLSRHVLEQVTQTNRTMTTSVDPVAGWHETKPG
jgi:hypothetical protein